MREAPGGFLLLPVDTISTRGGRGLVFFTRPQENVIFTRGESGFSFFSSYTVWPSIKEQT